MEDLGGSPTRPRMATAPGTSAVRRNALAGAIGSVLEWYDFAVYGYLAPIIGKRFFPSDDPVASLLAAFSVFAVGFAARPVGGALFGYLGDKAGRKPALMVSVLTMGVGTFLIGVLPTYDRIGAAAAVALVVLRIAEGISVGGEFTGAIVLLAEHAPSDRRGSYAIWPEVGCMVGFLLGSGIGALTSTLLGPERMLAWGWRVPFLLGATIAIWGIVFRSQMTESPLLEEARKTAPQASLRSVLLSHGSIVARFVGVLFTAGIGFYTMFIYAAAYLTEHMHVSTARALDINSACLFLMIGVLIAAAVLSDRLGRKPLIYAANLGMLALSWPLWWLMRQESLFVIFLGQAGFGILFAVGFGSIPALMGELLPTQVRCTGIGVAYNVAIGLFGGTAPLIVTYLVARTGDDFAPVYYVMGAAVVSLVSLLGLPETARQPAA